MYYKFSVLLFYLTIYSQFTIVVYGDDELRSKKKKGQSEEQEKKPSVCILPIPLQSYQPSYVHSGVQFQHSYIGTNEELRKKGKPLRTDSKGCVVVTVAPAVEQNESSENQAIKKTKKKIKPIKIKRRRKKKKQQAQMLAMLEHDLGSAFKDLMTSLDYFWPKLQITFTTGTASIGHNIFTGIIPLMAAGMKIKKILFLMMDPVMSSIWYSMGYSGHRPRPKTEIPQEAEGENDEAHETDVQEDAEETHYSDSAVVTGQHQVTDNKDDDDDDEEDEEEDEEAEGEADEDEGEEEDEEESSGEKDEEEEEEENDTANEDYEISDQTVNGNIDYPSDPSKDSGEVNIVKNPKKKKEDDDDFFGLKHIWNGMVAGFDDLSMTSEYRQLRKRKLARILNS